MSPALTRSRRSVLLAIPLGLLLLYACLLLVACSMQRSFMYPRSVTGELEGAFPPPPPEAEVVRLDIGDGEQVEAWYFASPQASAASPRPAVIFCHGNGEVITDQEPYLGMYQLWDVSVLLVEYRGYGRSGGSPSQLGIAADLDRFRDWLAARPEVDPDHLIYHGRSLGGAAAADLAGRHPPGALVLVSTFTTMGDMFRRYFIPGSFARDRWDTRSVVESFDGPILIFHGRRDGIVPVSHGRTLASLGQNVTYHESDDNHYLPEDWMAHHWQLHGFLTEHGILP